MTSLHSWEMNKQVNVRCGVRFPARDTRVSPDFGSRLFKSASPSPECLTWQVLQQISVWSAELR